MGVGDKLFNKKQKSQEEKQAAIEQKQVAKEENERLKSETGAKIKSQIQELYTKGQTVGDRAGSIAKDVIQQQIESAKENKLQKMELKEAKRKESERVEAERKESEQIEAERKELERLAAERKELERLAAERKELERIVTERRELERLESERIELKRISDEREERERLALERIELDRREAERGEQERMEQERKDEERKELERQEAERKELAREQMQIRMKLQQEEKLTRKNKFKKGFAVLIRTVVIMVVVLIAASAGLSYMKDYRRKENNEQNAAVLDAWVVDDGYSQKNTENIVLSVDNLEEANRYLSSLSSSNFDEIEHRGDKTFYREVVSFDANDYTNLDPATSIIFPGAIIDGNTLAEENYTLIGLPRRPIELVGNFSSARASAISIIVDNPKYSEVLLGRNQLVQNNAEFNVSANLQFSNHIIYDEQDMQVAIGATYNPPLISKVANANLNTSAKDKKIKTNMVVKIIQPYYTLSVQPPEQPSYFFADGADFSVLKNVSPAYVSDVTYGRLGILIMKSEAKEDELSAAISAEIAVAPVGGEVDSKYKKVWGKTTMDIYIIGGGADRATDAVGGYDAFMDFIRGGNSREEKMNAVPISYKLRYVSDNKPVPSVRVASERVTENNPENMMVTLNIKALNENNYNGIMSISAENLNIDLTENPYEFVFKDGKLDKENIKSPGFIFQSANEDASINFNFEGVTSASNLKLTDVPLGTSNYQIIEPFANGGYGTLALDISITKTPVKKDE